MKRAVIIIAQGVEDAEFVYPYYRLQEEGFTVDVAVKGKAEVKGKHGLPIVPNVDAETLQEADYDLVIVPGGHEAPDRVRQIKPVLQLLRDFDAKGKIISSTCHGPWVLVSAGVLRGRNATSYVGCKDDLVNAGANWIEAPVVVDKNIITSPHYRDNAVWMRETIDAYNKYAAGL